MTRHLAAAIGLCVALSACGKAEKNVICDGGFATGWVSDAYISTSGFVTWSNGDLRHGYKMLPGERCDMQVKY